MEIERDDESSIPQEWSSSVDAELDRESAIIQGRKSRPQGARPAPPSGGRSCPPSYRPGVPHPADEWCIRGPNVVYRK